MACPTMAKVDENLETGARQNAVLPPASNVNTETARDSTGMGFVRYSEDSQSRRGRGQEFPTEWTLCSADYESPGLDSGSDEDACPFGNHWGAQGDFG